MSNTIVEGKKISDLSLAVDLKDDAVVTIVQGGVTVKMKLSLMIQKIEERVAGKDSGIVLRINNLAKSVNDAKDGIEKTNDALKTFQDDVSDGFEKRDAAIAGMHREIRESIYYKSEVSLAETPDALVMSYVINMDGVAVGDIFDIDSALYTDTTSKAAYTLCFDAKKGDILEAAYTIIESGSAPYVIITDADQMILDMITVSEFILNGYTFREDGSLYLSVMQPESANMIKFTHFEAINFTDLINHMNLAEYPYDHTMMNLTGKTYDTAAAEVGSKYTPLTDGGNTATTYAHMQRVEEGWILSFAGCLELVRGDAYNQLVITDADGIVTKLFDFSEITESFEYVFASDEKYFYLSSDSVTADPIFKLMIPRQEMPLITGEDNGKVLQVVDGKWKAVSVSVADTAEDGNGEVY